MRVLFILISLLSFGSVHSQDAELPESFQTKFIYDQCLESIKVVETGEGDLVKATACIVIWDGWIAGLLTTYKHSESSFNPFDCDILSEKRGTEFSYLFTDWVRDNPQYRGDYYADVFFLFAQEFC